MPLGHLLQRDGKSDHEAVERCDEHTPSSTASETVSSSRPACVLITMAGMSKSNPSHEVRILGEEGEGYVETRDMAGCLIYECDANRT